MLSVRFVHMEAFIKDETIYSLDLKTKVDKELLNIERDKIPEATL